MNSSTQPATPFFLQDLHNDATKKEIQSSPFWPVIVAAINQIKDDDDSLVVGSIERFPQTNALRSVDLVTRAGLRVCAVYRDSEDSDEPIVFGSLNDPDRLGPARLGMHVAVSSKNVKYIVRKLKDRQSDPSHAVHNRWRDAKMFFNRVLNRMMERGVKANGVMPVDFTIPNYAATALVRAFMGDINKMDIPQNVVTVIESQYREFLKRQEKARNATVNLRQMLDNDKWVIVSDMSGAVIVGAISKHPLQAALNQYEQVGELPDDDVFTYTDVIVPFKYYSSFDAIEDDIRRDIEMQLTMLKVHTNSEGPPLLTAQTCPREYKVYPDIGVMLRGEYSQSPVIVVDKSI